jgi:hypothetical protein
MSSMSFAERRQKTVDAGDDEGVAGAREVEQHLQLDGAISARPLAFSAEGADSVPSVPPRLSFVFWSPG